MIPAPFSDEPCARVQLEKAKASAKLGLGTDLTQSRIFELVQELDAASELAEKRSLEDLIGRKLRVYADGVFDLFHPSHSRMFLQAKNFFGAKHSDAVYVIAGCTSKELTEKMKGPTIMDSETRYEALTHCRYVDEVLRDAPWCLDSQFLEDKCIDFVAHDDAPYKSASNQKGEIEDIYAFLKTKDKFLATKRGEISTTDLLVKIISRYEEYVMRNLNRGVNRQEMNVSWLRLSLIRVRSFISKLFGSLLFLK